MAMQSALVMDEATGFMETSGGYAHAFDGQRKQDFLLAYKANGLRFKKTCKLVAVSEHTINHHYANDPAFRKAFDEVEKEYAEDLQCTSMEIALTPKGFMDRIAQLRRFFPGKYAPAENQGQPKIEINIAGDFVTGQKSDAAALETTIVRAIESDSVLTVDDHDTHAAHIPTPSTEADSSSELMQRGDRP